MFSIYLLYKLLVFLVFLYLFFPILPILYISFLRKKLRKILEKYSLAKNCDENGKPVDYHGIAFKLKIPLIDDESNIQMNEYSLIIDGLKFSSFKITTGDIKIQKRDLKILEYFNFNTDKINKDAPFEAKMPLGFYKKVLDFLEERMKTLPLDAIKIED